MASETVEPQTLTIYRLRENVRDFRDAIAPRHLAEVKDYPSGDPYEFGNLKARLYVKTVTPKRPDWVKYLTAFGELPEIQPSVRNSAVLIVQASPPLTTRDCFFALTFGFGRYLLRRDGYEPGYGLKTALSAMYPKERKAEWASARVRSVDTKTVAANTLHTRRQVDRRANFEYFGVDTQRDLLTSITGAPATSEEWGTRITGADHLRLATERGFEELGDLLAQIERTFDGKGYTVDFGWIEQFHLVSDSTTIENLEGQLLQMLREKNTDTLQLAPPMLVNWDEIAYFRLTGCEDRQYDLDLTCYLDALPEQEREDWTLETLRDTYTVRAVDAAGRVTHTWPLFRCISGELKMHDHTYLCHGGDFYSVAPDYIQRLDRYVNQMEETHYLADSPGDIGEGLYNELVAALTIVDQANHEDQRRAQRVLLDRRTVDLEGRTSPVEICDVLAKDEDEVLHFIHVKRKLSSSDLSHLFSQGYVSGDLLWASPEYRRDVLSKAEGFCSFEPGQRIPPNKCTVVYAIVADWGDRDVAQALPFFSKVNLRRHAEDLRRMGYRVNYERVQVQKEQPLKEEFALTDRYLETQTRRLGDRLRVVRDIAAETLSMAVPCAIVQPLVQFALKNLEPGAGTLTLTIEAKAEADKVRIRLVDQGKTRPQKWELASIWQKVKDRLHSKYNDAARLLTYKEQPEGALFTLEIPSVA